MILTTIASIASILGFSMQIFNSLKNEEDKLIFFLIKMSEKSTYLKEVHTQYHAIYRGITSLDNFLRNPDKPNLYRRKTNLNRDELLNVINNETLKEFSESIDKVLSEEMKQISVQIDFKTDENFKSLSEVNNKMAFNLQKIIQSQNNVIELHNQYCSFFKDLKALQDKEELSEDDAQFILNNKRLTSTNYNNIIMDTDQALMLYLDIYSFVLDDIKSKRKF